MELTSREFADFDAYLVPCLIESGFGGININLDFFFRRKSFLFSEFDTDRFNGNRCVVDSDCDRWSGRCNYDTGLCASLPINEVFSQSNSSLLFHESLSLSLP